MARLDEMQRIADQHRKYSKLKKVFVTFACLVVFVTTYMLVLPALTMETELVCNKGEHKHDSSCYKVSKELVCDKEEREGHMHSSSCYKTEKVLTCTDESPDHSHSDSCYKEEKKLICDKDECEGHKHGDSCYEEKEELTCDKEEHTHGDSCYKKKEEATTQEEAAEATTEQAEEASTEEADPGKFDLTAETEGGENHAIVTIKGDYKTFDAKPEDISLKIKYSDDEAADQLVADKYGQEADNIAKIYHYNIRIKDKEDDIDPKDKISVQLEGIALGSNKEKVDVYTLKDGDLNKVDIELKENGGIKFESSKFADVEYVVVAFNETGEVVEEPVEEKTATEFTFEDGSIKVVATLSEEAKMPETAEFKVSKLAEGSKEFQESENKIQEYAKANNLTILGHIPYDMHFEVDGKEIEPEGAVQVNVTYKKAMDVPENVKQDTQKDDKIIPFETKGDSKESVAAVEEDNFMVLHLKEEANGVSVEDITQKVEVNQQEKVEEVAFTTESFSVIDITKVDVSNMNVKNWITPGADANFKTILGDAIYYGMTVNTFHKTGHIDSTFAAKLLEGTSDYTNITTGKYTGGDGKEGAIWIASMTGKLRIDGDKTAVYCPESFLKENGGGLELQNGSHNIPVTQQKAESYVDSMRSHVIRQSEILAGQPTYTLTGDAINQFNNNNKTINLTSLPNGTYYLDGDFFFAEKRDLVVKINGGQNVVFNYAGTTAKICQYKAVVDEVAYDSATSDNSMDVVASHFIFNMPNATTITQEGGCCGVFLAPYASYTIGSTSSGWIVCDWMSSDRGEWHFVYQDIPEDIPTDVGFKATKMIDEQVPTDKQKFSFTLDELVTGQWKNVQTISNEGKKINFDDITYSEVATHWYLISEKADASLEKEYQFSTDQFVEKVVITAKVNGSTTTYNRYVTKYKVDPTKTLLVGGKVNEQALIEVFSDSDIKFVNHKKVDTSIEVDKKWFENGVDLTAAMNHEPISFKLIQIASDGQEKQYPDNRTTYSISKENGWKYIFDHLPSSEGNVTFTYKVEESIEDDDYTVTYDNNNGIVSGTIQIINTRKETSIDMKKVWVNVDEDKTPDSITFGVYNGDTPVTTFVLSKKNVTGGTEKIHATMTADWAAKVNGLPVLETGSYTVKELYIGSNPKTEVVVKEDGTVEAGAYKVIYSTEDGVLVITNELVETYELPHTGGMGTTPFTISGLALLGIAGGMLIMNRRKEEE